VVSFSFGRSKLEDSYTAPSGQNSKHHVMKTYRGLHGLQVGINDLWKSNYYTWGGHCWHDVHSEFHENMPFGYSVLGGGQTDGHDDASSLASPLT
jgi:hypothetical protein